MVGKKPWRKVLYERQDYPDNYADKKIFLRDLKKNIDFKEITLTEAVLGANLLTQELCTVVGFVLVFFYLVNEWVEPSFLLNISSLLTILGFIVYLLLFTTSVKNKLGQDLRTVLIFIVFGQMFSPVLHTLTDTISTDTIYTSTIFMMLVHLLFFDYGVNAAIVSNSLSLSAAVFASICLASRLSSAREAFVLLTISIECFVLFPMFKREGNRPVLVTLVLLTVDTYFLARISNVFLILFITAIVFIGIICPILFVKHQTYKDNIYGPWDEAVVDDADILVY